MRIGSTALRLTGEPVVGWKIWRVDHDEERTRLRSVLYGSLWPPGRPAVAAGLMVYGVPVEVVGAPAPAKEVVVA